MPNPFLRTTAIALVLVALAASLLACVSVRPMALEGAPGAATAPAAAPAAAPDSDGKARPAGWRAESHSNDVVPNYDAVFPIDAVNTLTITITPADWAAMQVDMAEIYGTQDKAPAPAADNRSPLWAPAVITFQGQEWTQVGVRYKGGSSLRPWKEGELRLPFKFDYELLEAAGLPSLRSTPYAIVLEDV